MSKKHYYRNIKGKAVVKGKSFFTEKNYLKDMQLKIIIQLQI